MLCVPCLISSVREMDCSGKETVSVSGHSGSQWLFLNSKNAENGLVFSWSNRSTDLENVDFRI